MIGVAFRKRYFLNSHWSVEMGCDEDWKYVCHRHPRRLEEELCCFGFVEICELLPATSAIQLDRFYLSLSPRL